MDPSVFRDRFTVQLTRLPAEIPKSTNAQCLEGTILFATLLEAIGIPSIIVTVPGHAFVGWHTSPKDHAACVRSKRLFFLETTIVSGSPFKAAVKTANARVLSELKQGAFKYGVSKLLDLKKLRKLCVLPQPM